MYCRDTDYNYLTALVQYCKIYNEYDILFQEICFNGNDWDRRHLTMENNNGRNNI